MNPSAEQAGLTRDNRPVMLASAMQTSDRLGLLRALREEALAVATQRQQARRELAEEADGADVFLYGFARGRVQGLDDAIALVSDPSEAVQSARVLLAIEVQRMQDEAATAVRLACSRMARSRRPEDHDQALRHTAYADGAELTLRRVLNLIIGKGNRVDAEGVYEPCNVCGRNRPRLHAKSCASCWDELLRVAPNRCVKCEKALAAGLVPAECFRCSDRRGDAEQDAIALHADGLL